MYKRQVPTGLSSKDVTLKADIYDGSKYYNEISNNRATIPYTYYTTPDTHYEEKAPAGFSVPASPSDTNGSATWYEYVYENGSFVRKNYGIALAKSVTNTITPATGETAVQKDGQWTMKSGYGFSVNTRTLTANVSGYTAAPAASYTCLLYTSRRSRPP